MKIRTTMMPDREFDVEPSEYVDLSRQGLLVEGKGTNKAPDLTGTNMVFPPVTEGTD